MECQALKLVKQSLKNSNMHDHNIQEQWTYGGVILVMKQLFDYGSAVRKVMYTTNAIEAINSSFRKVTKKGAFPNENALLKLLYLRISELYKKWNKRPQNNWALVRNQLDMDEKIQERIRKYENGGF